MCTRPVSSSIVVCVLGSLVVYSVYVCKYCIYVRGAVFLYSSTVQCSQETIVLSDSEQGSSSCKPVVLSSSDSESHVDESGLGLESRYVRVTSQ